MDGVLKRLPARFRHPVPNETGEAIKRFIEGPLRGSREERHRKGLAAFRRLGHSSLNQIRPPSSRTTGASFLFFLGCWLNRLGKLPIRRGTPAGRRRALTLCCLRYHRGSAWSEAIQP